MWLVSSQRFVCKRWCHEDTPSFPWGVSFAAPQTCLSSSGIWRGFSRCSSRWLEPCGNTHGLTLYLFTGRGYFSSCWGWWLLQQLAGLPAGLSLGTSGCSVSQLHIHPRGEIQTVSLAFGDTKSGACKLSRTNAFSSLLCVGLFEKVLKKPISVASYDRLLWGVCVAGHGADR